MINSIQHKQNVQLSLYHVVSVQFVVLYGISEKNNLIDNKWDDGPYIHGTNKKVKLSEKIYIPMINPPDLYIITTAMKRDSMEWDEECIPFMFNHYPMKVTIDSWNNIQKYKDVTNAFFIFDEDRVVGYGKWVQAFIKLAKANQWILLTATPGDRWHDYIPVFIANGFIKNKTSFEKRYVEFNPYITKYRKVEKYINQGELIKFRRLLLIEMDFERSVVKHHEHVISTYDQSKYDFVKKSRWNIFKDKPIENSGEYCNVLRRIVNDTVDREMCLLNIIAQHRKAIIFYNYDYELERLRNLFKDYTYAERNGHKHQTVPTGDEWVYLVQYASGAEAWNCITTDTIIFYSMNYSYKVMEQASGRIDRLNTPFSELFYFHLRTDSDIDNKIRMTLRQKKKFNEDDYAPFFKSKKKDSGHDAESNGENVVKEYGGKNVSGRTLSLFEI